MVVMRDEVIALFSRRRVAWSRLDAAALAAEHTDDCVAESPMAGQLLGRAAMEHVYRAWFDGFPDLALEIEDPVVDGERSVEIGTLSGTDTGGFMGLPATGKAFRVPAVFVYGLEDGKIARFRSVYDFTGILVQTGLMKAKPV